MRRLYVRVYLAVLGSLIVFALLAGAVSLTFRLLESDDNRRSWPLIGAEIMERLLPAGGDANAASAELNFWREKTGHHLVLLSKDGAVIAQAGAFPKEVTEKFASSPATRLMWVGRGVYGITLNDGRRLFAYRLGRDGDGWHSLRWLGILFGIGFAIALCVYPVVRHLTRNLERLQQGVAEFGAGNLSARVSVNGRDEIAKLADTFNTSAERIQRLMATHKTLLANASHELRSPLARLRMAIEASPSPETRGEIARNIGELNALIDEILLASRLDAAGHDATVFETLDLVGLLAEECAAYDIELQSTTGALPIHGDARLLRRLFRNLLDNARQHGSGALAEGDHSDVTVTATRSDGAALIAVGDRGPGIANSEHERIFEPFYRLASPRDGGGSGLGLALARQISERHGGAIRYVPRQDGGACFEVMLPLEKPVAAGV